MNKTLALIAALGLVVAAPAFADDAQDLANANAKNAQIKANANAVATKKEADAEADKTEADAKADKKIAKAKEKEAKIDNKADEKLTKETAKINAEKVPTAGSDTSSTPSKY